jgi:HlyD family secretion protein
MARLLKIFVATLIVAALVVGAYFWLKGRGEKEQEFELVKVERGEITEKAVAVGQIEPRLKFEVKSKISGIVKRCVVDVGDLVKPGDPLFEIVPDPTPTELVEAEAQVHSAEAAFNRAEAEWRRVTELTKEGISAREEEDIKREAFEIARIALQSAKDNLDLVRQGRIAGRGRQMESIIRAPAGGIVLQRLVDPGDPVVPLTTFQAGTELATIANMGDLIFMGTVDEIDVGKLSLDVAARLNIGALPDQVVTGRLSRIAPQAKEEEGARLFDVEIELDSVDDILLRAGYSATADLVIREKSDILMIPERLIPAVTPGAEPQKVEIETGLSDGLNIEVLTGLEEGAEVVERPPRDILG